MRVLLSLLVLALSWTFGKVFSFLKATGAWLFLTLYPLLFLAGVYGTVISMQVFGGYENTEQVIAIFSDAPLSPISLPALITSESIPMGFIHLCDWCAFICLVITLIPVIGITIRSCVRLIKKDRAWAYRSAHRKRQLQKNSPGTQNIAQLKAQASTLITKQ